MAAFQIYVSVTGLLLVLISVNELIPAVLVLLS